MNEQAIKKIITIYSDLENRLLDEIVRHFNVNEEFINSDYFRLEKLQELGLLNQNIVDYIAKATNTTPSEIKKALNAIGFETLNINNLNNQYKQGHIKIDPSVLLQNKVVENAINFSYNELTNRFVEISNKIETATRDAYLNVVEKTYVQTLAGKTYQESIRDALLELGDKGITTLTYKTTDSEGNVVGIRNYDVEGTVRRELVTATHNLVNNINQEVAEELDAEYVLLSEHIACRPSHFPWQGTIIKRTQIVEVTGYGEVDGMGGPNCKHYPSPYFGTARGSELKTITQEEAERRYELAQKQRYLERGVRKWKRRERLFKNAEDKEYYKKCKEKVKEWQSRTQAFTSDNNLTRSFSRENVENVTINNSTKKEVPDNYTDLTEELTNREFHKQRTFKNQDFVIGSDGNKYVVDGKNVILDHTESEENIAVWYGQKMNTDINMLPRVCNPSDVKTADFIAKTTGYTWEIKEPTSSNAKNIITNSFKHQKEKAQRFIIDIHNSKVDVEELINELNSNLSNERYSNWIEEVIIKNNEQIIKSYKK